MELADGSSVQLTPGEVMEFATYGYGAVLKNQAEAKPKEDPKEPTIASLQKEIEGMKAAKTQEQSVAGINQQLMTAANSIEATKEDPEFASSVAVETLARYNLNPRLNIQNTFQKVYDQRMKKITKMIERQKEKESANRTVKNSLSATMRGGGSPAIPAGQERKAEDIKTGASRRALAEFLRAQGDMD